MKQDQSDIVYLMPLIEHAAAQSAVVIEIGCGHGNGSTRALARGIARSHAHEDERLFITVDIDPERPDEKPDLPYWHAVYGPSEDENTAAHVARILNGRRADLIFIDTIHTYEHLKREHELWSPLSHRDTVWLYHDTWIWGPYNNMTDAAKEYAAANGLLYQDASIHSHGLGMVASDPHSDWPYPEGEALQCPRL